MRAEAVLSGNSVLIAVLMTLALLPQVAPTNFPADDALFYLQVARHIAEGHGSTFNTITPTNGYHPLWMAICVVSALVSDGNSLLLLRVIFAIQAVLALLILLAFRRLVASVSPSGWILGIPIAGVYFLTGMYGSEAHLNGALVMASLLAAFRSALSSRLYPIVLGLLLGLTVLARLDNVFVAASIGLTGWIARPVPWGSRIRGAMATFTVTGLVLAPYLAHNLVVFGGLLPVSGAIKSTWPYATIRFGNLGVVGGLAFTVGCVGLVLSWIPSLPQRLRLLHLSLGPGVLAHGAYVVLYTDHLTQWSWYYVPGVIHLAIVAVSTYELITQHMSTTARKRIAISIAAILVALGFVRGYAHTINPQAVGKNQFKMRFNKVEKRWALRLADWMTIHLSKNAGVMVNDFPGTLAFYSTLRILPEDGLIGDYEYNRLILSEGIVPYLRERDVDYYIGPLKGEGEQGVDVRAPLSGQSAGVLPLHRTGLILRIRDLPHMDLAPDFGLWRLDLDSVSRDTTVQKAAEAG
jgi:hypothetical protein